MIKKILPLRRIEGATDEMSDDALVVACGMGERAALGALFDRHHDAVRRFVARLSGWADSDLDDLVQQTFVAVCEAARGFDGRAAVRTWLFGVARNVARHHVRAEVRRRRASEAYARDPRTVTADAAGEVLERERAARLGEAVVALPIKLREAFVLVYLEGLAGTEVAALLGIREGALWKRLHEARARLREQLQGGAS